MAHSISAILLRGHFDVEAAKRYDLTPIGLGSNVTLFPIDAGYCDRWSSELEAPPDASTSVVLLDCGVIHRIVRAISDDPLFAIIETDYFGGAGDQAAVVYNGDREVLPPRRAPIGPINNALRALGVRADPGRDEFDTVGLGRFRSLGS